MNKMIDRDIYCVNSAVEEFFLQLTAARISKDYPAIKVYTSTAGLDSHWTKKLYDIFNNTELMEG